MASGWRCAALVAALCVCAGLARAACTNVDPTHTEWTRLLERWVENGEVDYAGMLREDKDRLNAYLATLSGACASDYERWTREERIAFWINAYNAFTVRLILDHYPVASVRKIGWLPGAAFREAFIPMAGLKGRTISLGDIEHGTLRSAFHEPRIHFALVCAARSCPPLRGEAYRATDLDGQLEDQGRAFLRDPQKNRVDPASRTLYVSSIFQWFREDFEQASGSLPSFVARYLEPGTALDPDARIEFLDYDWSLNDRAAVP